MALADRCISRRFGLVTPLASGALQPASVDLHLGNELLIVSPLDHGRAVDLRVDDPAPLFQQVRLDCGSFTLRPGGVALATTAERVRIPADLMGRVEGRSSLGRLFLFVHVTAGFIDPGFEGEVTLELVNAGPFALTLYAGMGIAQISFSLLCCSAERMYGSEQLGSHYQHQIGPTPAVGRRSA